MGFKSNKTLDQLFIQHGTDKSSKHHNYSPNYEKHLEHLRYEPVKMLIIGVGGYEYPDRGGGDIKAFSEYFPHAKAKIYALDLYDKSGLKFNDRVKIFKGSQDDGDCLTKVMIDLGEPDVIIDDGSHMNGLTIQSFKHLFPWVKPGGTYVIEDIESSWWNEHGFDGEPNPTNLEARTTINFCRMLLNQVNVKHIKGLNNNFPIDSMHFYNNMVVIKKAI